EGGLRRRNALPLVGEIVLLHAGERAGGGGAGVVERVRRRDLVGNVLGKLRGDHRGFRGRGATAIGHLVGATEVTAGGGVLRADGVPDVGRDLRKLGGGRRIVADHAAIGVGR